MCVRDYLCRETFLQELQVSDEEGARSAERGGAVLIGIPAEVKEKFINRIPLKRIGQPDDIANLVAFLASDAASYITGQCIQACGGLSVGISGI